jgi:hypothetical protein
MSTEFGLGTAQQAGTPLWISDSRGQHEQRMSVGGIDTMAVIEIRIEGTVDLNVIDADGAMAAGADRRVVVVRAARPAATELRRAAVAPRRASSTLNYAGWHARLVGDTRRA